MTSADGDQGLPHCHPQGPSPACCFGPQPRRKGLVWCLSSPTGVVLAEPFLCCDAQGRLTLEMVPLAAEVIE